VLALEREFNFSRHDFDLFRRLVKEHTGINLSDHKQEMLYSRLARRLRVLDIRNFHDYYHYLKKENENELIQFVNAVTTNLTAFFREPHHFEFLARVLLPQLIEMKADSKRIRIWSAGCASGEEAYSLAIVIKEVIPRDWDVKILATDLDSSMIAKAQEGIYISERVTHISKSRLHRWFKKGVYEHQSCVQAVPELRSMITFKQLNLMNAWPMHGPLDIIFCRNVVIYFDKETQKILFDRFANLLGQPGYLFIGHSENLFQLTKRFRLIQQTIYQKT